MLIVVSTSSHIINIEFIYFVFLFFSFFYCLLNLNNYNNIIEWYTCENS
jgi:hypothetical protein